MKNRRRDLISRSICAIYNNLNARQVELRRRYPFELHNISAQSIIDSMYSVANREGVSGFIFGGSTPGRQPIEELLGSHRMRSARTSLRPDTPGLGAVPITIGAPEAVRGRTECKEVVRALERAQRVEEAMLCRGYSGRFPHAALPAPGIRDWAAFAGLSGLAVATLLVDRI